VEAPFRDPDIPAGEVTAYRGLIGREQAGRGTNRIDHIEGGYRQSLTMVVRDQARYSATIDFRRDHGRIFADAYRLETLYGEAPVALEEGHFRGVKALGWGGTLELFPKDLAPLLGCALALRGLEFEQGAQRSFSLWLANSVYWEVGAKIERVEEVTLLFGTVSAWRVRLRPHFGQVARRLDRLLQFLLPPFTLHFGQQPPHRFLRFSFPTGPFPWNPRGRIEAVAVTEHD
jgi:hypothetical protein